MADTLPFFVAESGTYSATGPSVTLSGTAAGLSDYPARTFVAAAADTSISFDSGNKCTVVIVKSASNYKRYTGATWTSGSPSSINLSTATLEGSSGTIADGDAVTVFGGIPSDILTGALAAEAAAQGYATAAAESATALEFITALYLGAL